MCYTIKPITDGIRLGKPFHSNFNKANLFPEIELLSGFTFPKIPVLTNNLPNEIQFFSWGLIPKWSKTVEFRKNTLNARIETISEKLSFKSLINQRCIIIIEGFYEYQWLDTKGKTKQRYLMMNINNQPLNLGGLWNSWTDINSGEVFDTFTILTIEANQQMAVIHNTKKRMPLIIDNDNTQDWLAGNLDIRTYELKLNIVKA